MTSTLDLGSLFVKADILDEPFNKKLSAMYDALGRFGTEADKAAAGVTTLDRGLVSAAGAADKLSTSTTRTTRTTSENTAAEDKRAAAVARGVAAQEEMRGLLASTADLTPKVQQATLRLAAAQDRLNALNETGVASTRQLASANASLLGAQRSLTRAQEEGAVAGSKFGASLKSGLKMAGELGLLIGGIEVGKKIVEYVAAGRELTTALNSIQAASRATDTEMAAVRAEAIKLGKDLRVPGATAVDAANAIEDLVKAGVTLPRAMIAARSALLLAGAAAVGTADAARVLGDVLDEFKLPAEQAAKTASTLAAAANLSAGGLMAVFQAFTYVGTRARALGLGVADIAAAIVDLSKAGIQADRAGTGMAMMLQKLALESDKGQAALDDLGVTAWNAQGKFVGLPKVIDQLHAAQQRFGVGSQRFVQDVSQAFGARAANVVTAFALKGVDSYNRFLGILKSGNVQHFADLMNRGVSAGFAQMNKEFTAAGIDLYQKFEPAINKAVWWIGTEIPKAASAAGDFLSPFAHFLGGAFADAWHVAGGAISIVGDVLGPVVHLLGDLKTPLGAAATAALGMWAAFKVGTLVADGLAALPGLFTRLEVAVVTGSSNAMGALDRLGAQFGITAGSAVTSGAAIEGASTAAADTVVAEGEAARIGWLGMLGPLAAVGVGIGLLVSMFHKSDTASKEATAAAKAYTDALKSGGGPGSDSIFGAIVQQLSDNKVPELLASLNKELGQNAFNGGQFVTAIQKGGPALSELRQRLQDIVKAGTTFQAISGGRGYVGQIEHVTPAARDAAAALGHLNTQYSTLNKQARSELIQASQYHLVAASIDRVAVSTRLSSDAAKQYATMLGITYDKSGIVAMSQQDLAAKLKVVSDAYNVASQSGSDFLTALDTFSKSAATAADRAALIGATLKAANGDALGFASAMNAGAAADDGLTSSMKQAASQVGKHGESVKALTTSIVNLKTGTIDYSKQAAAPLISGLQAMQTAAMNAAQATYQHEVQTKGAATAATDAYNVYRSQTRGALIDEATQLGLTSGQAKTLADRYFGMPKHVKTLIQAEGANSLVSVLKRLGALLAHLTGQQWNVHVNEVVVGTHLKSSGTGGGIGVIATPSAVGSRAAFKRPDGKVPPNTVATVGEGTSTSWEGLITDSQGRATILSNPQAKAMGFRAPVGYASGSLMGYVTGAGFRGRSAQIMDAIEMAESGGSATAHNYNPGTGDDSYGLAQINMLGSLAPERIRAYHLPSSPPYGLFDPATNNRVAWAMSNHGRDFSPWTTYTSGAYLKFMGGDGTLSNASGSLGTSPSSAHAAAQAARQKARQQRQAARGAVRAGNQLDRMGASHEYIDRHGRLRGHASSVSDIRSQIGTLMSDLHDAGASKAFLRGLKDETDGIIDAARKRNHAEHMLELANRAVRAAVAKRRADFHAFRSVDAGIFDITTAGQNATTGRASPGSILATQRQAITRLRAWFSGLKKIESKVPATYFRSLEAKGPDALPELQALEHMNPGQFRTLRHQQRELAALANRAASYGSTKLDQGAVRAAEHQERIARREARRDQHEFMQELRKLGDKLDHLSIDGVAKFDFKRGTLQYALTADQHHVRKARGGG